MEKFFEQNKCPIGRMVTIWGERLGLEEWAIREAAEEYYQNIPDNFSPIDVSWDVLAIAELKQPVIIRKKGKLEDPNIRVEVNRLRTVIANLRDSISDLLHDKEKMWSECQILKSDVALAEEHIRSLRKDNLAFSSGLEAQERSFKKDLQGIEQDIEHIKRSSEIDKLENDVRELQDQVKSKRRWWGRK